jgi:hypothetical protein
MEGEAIGWYADRAFTSTTELNIELTLVESVRDDYPPGPPVHA